MKRNQRIGIIFGIMVLCSLPLYANNRIIIDGYTLSGNSIVENSRTLVPFRDVFMAIGADVDWNKSTQQLTAKKEDISAVLTLNSNKAIVNGKTRELSVAPIQKNGITYVPLRFVTEIFGGTLDIDKNTEDILIYSEDVSLSKIHIKRVLEPLGLVPVIVKSADLNNDRVRDYVVAACEPDDKEEVVPSSTKPFELMIVDGKSGSILARESVPYHWTDELDMSIKKSGNHIQIIYDRGNGKLMIFKYNNSKIIQDKKAVFIQNNKVVVNEKNITSLYGLSMDEAKNIFGTSNDPWFEVYPASKVIGINYEAQNTPCCIVFFTGSEFMGLNFTESPQEVKKKLGEPIDEGWSDKDQAHTMSYQVLGHPYSITFRQNGKGIYSIETYNSDL